MAGNIFERTSSKLSEDWDSAIDIRCFNIHIIYKNIVPRFSALAKII